MSTANGITKITTSEHASKLPTYLDAITFQFSLSQIHTHYTSAYHQTENYASTGV